MRRLVVHIGAPKTATTYIQHALFLNADLLAQHGVYLPVTGRNEMQRRSVGHHHLVWELTDPKRFRRSIGGWDELVAEVRKVKSDTVLLSAEGLSQVVAVHSKTAELMERLFALSDDVTVVMAVRDQLSLINSMYCQAVKMLNSATPTFDRYAARALSSGTFDLHDRFQEWYDVDRLRFTVVPFAQFREVDPLVGILRAGQIEIPEDRLILETDSSNVSLGPIGIEAARLLARYLHGHDKEFSRRQVSARRLHRVSAAYARNAGWCQERFWGWTSDSAHTAAEQFAESNEQFAQAVWGTAWNMPMPVDVAPTTVVLDDLPATTVEAIHDYLFAMAHRYETLRADGSD